MALVAYIYFKTPDKESTIDLFKNVINSGFNVSHFGRNDPPKKWNKNIESMNNELFKVESEVNKWCFLRDKSKKLEMTIHLTFDGRWTFSDISMSGKDNSNLKEFAARLAHEINAFLCIQGISEKGKDQVWNLLYEDQSCPEEIKYGLKFT